MVPIHDDNPVSITPWITWGLIAANIFLFLIELSLSDNQLQDFLYQWAFVPCQLFETCSTALPRSAFPEWMTLITSQFLHGGFGHIIGNMLYLFIFGNNIEDRLGHLKFLIFYLACGALAAMAQGVFAPDSIIPTLGASGAIAGVLGAYVIRFPRAKVTLLLPIFLFFFRVRIPAFFFLGFWFAMQFLYGVASLDATADLGSQGGVAYWAHAGGFIVGILIAPILGLFSSSRD